MSTPDPTVAGETAAESVVICRSGQAAAWRKRLDAEGRYGVAVTESPWLPSGTEAIVVNLALQRAQGDLPGMFDDVVARGSVSHVD